MNLRNITQQKSEVQTYEFGHLRLLNDATPFLFGQNTTIMAWISQMFFTLLLLTLFFQASREAPLNKNLTSHVDRNSEVQQADCLGSECFWNCTYKVNRMDEHRQRISQAIFDEGRLFRVNVTYKIEHSDKPSEYRKQTVSSSIVKGAKQWRVRLNRPTNQEVSIFVQNALKDLAAFLERELILSIEASCKVQFGFNLTSATNQTKISELFPDYFQENILQITGLVRRGKACDEGDESLQNQNCISIQINEFTADGWTQSLLWWAIFCFVAIFSYIGPWVVCLFPATEVSYRPNRLGEDRLIIVNLQSPVGLRSLIGNFFFSADDMMGNRVKRFIMRIFILPVLFFLPALFVEYLQYNDILPRYNFLHISHLFSSVQLLCYCCYCLQAFLCNFSIGKPGIWSLLPLQMLIHFRTIYYFLKRWMLGIRFYIFMALCIIIDFSTHRTVSEIMMRLCGLCLLILFAPIMVYDWLVLFFVVVCLSFPMALVCGTEYFSFSRNSDDNFDDRIPFTRTGKYILVFCISCFATYGGLLVLRSAGLGILLSLKLAGKILFCEENLPYVTAFGVMAHSLWSSYGSFTKRYQKLAWALCNHYEKQAGIHRVESPDGSPYPMKIIPKRLFDRSCKNLFPIKEMRELIWKMVLYLTFICVGLFLAMLLDATSLTRAFVVAFTGAAPTILPFFVKKRKSRKKMSRKSLRNDDMAIDERARKVVHRYTKSNKKIRYYNDDFAPSFEEFLGNLKLNNIIVSYLVITLYDLLFFRFAQGCYFSPFKLFSGSC